MGQGRFSGSSFLFILRWSLIAFFLIPEVFAQEKPLTRDFSFCEPAIFSPINKRFSAPVPFAYRSTIRYDKMPSEREVIAELNSATFQKAKRFTTEISSYFVTVFCIQNISNEEIMATRYSNWIPLDSRLMILDEGHLKDLPHSSSIGHTDFIPLKAGVNILISLEKFEFGTDFDAELYSYGDIVTYAEKHDQSRMFLASFAGYVVMSLIFSIWLMITYRAIYLLYYSCYFAMIAMAVFRIHGIFLNDQNAMMSIGAGGSGIFLLLFGRYFFTHNGTRLFHFIKYAVYLQVAIVAYAILTQTWGMSGVSFCMSSLVFTASCILSSRIREWTVIMLLAGSLSITLAAFTFTINYYWPFNQGFTEQAVIVGMVMETLCFTYAMILKIRHSELDAQRKSAHAFFEMSKMVYHHQLEDIKNGATLESTMPTFPARACVISFDIMESSKIKHVNAKEFFRIVFSKCNLAMSEGYDGKNLKAAGYRIKEMGDGFLCSVGYPFESLSGSPVKDAVELAKTFGRILAEEARILQVEEPITCGIGIALDSLIGFYPNSGAREYDIYGRALILATRYERMRKILFGSHIGRSVLIIQDQVYDCLDSEYRAEFHEQELAVFTVRDDISAGKLYYRFLDEKDNSLQMTEGFKKSS